MKRSETEMINYLIDGTPCDFYCGSRSTRHGFAHDATLFVNGVNEGTETAHYLNRTWECFRYQSVIGSIVRAHVREERERIRAEWMRSRGYERMTAKRREEYEADQPTDDALEFWRALEFAIYRIPSIKYDGGAREREILHDPGNVRIVELSPGHRVYRIESRDGASFCDYDTAAKRFVG